MKVVYAYAKILILKQITTLPPYQEYNLEVVYAYAKILILKQITTGTDGSENVPTVVYAYAKILILKQITTKFPMGLSAILLYMPMQRY